MATFQVQNFSQGNAGNSTISGIANQFGVSQEALASANQGAFSNPGDLSSLQAGATLNIPGQETVITPESMQATDPLITEESSSVNNATADFNLNSLTRDQAETQRQEESQANQIANFTQMQELVGDPRSEEELRQEALTQTGVQERRQQEADLSSQLNSIVTSAQESKLSIGGADRGISAGVAATQSSEIDRQAAIKALPISAQLAAAQGNLALAEQEYNTLFQIKSVDAENKYNRNKESLQQFIELASSQDKARLELIDKQEDRKFEKAQASIKSQNALASTLLKNQAPSSIRSLVIEADSYEDALLIEGIEKYMESPLEKIQKRKYQADLDEVLNETATPGMDKKTRESFLKLDRTKTAASRIAIISALEEYQTRVSEVYANSTNEDGSRSRFLKKSEVIGLQTALNQTIGSAINVAQGQGAMGIDEADRILKNIGITRTKRPGIISQAITGSIQAQGDLLDSEFGFIESSYPGATSEFPLFADYKIGKMTDEELLRLSIEGVDNPSYFGN
jgi:hypothetical protein